MKQKTKVSKVYCPYCKKEAEYIDSKFYYRSGISYGMIYLCRTDDAMVGTHKNSGKPLGSLANRTLKDLRMEAHSLFDPLWKEGKMTRQHAYKLLKEKTGVEHIAWTNEQEARKVIKYLGEEDKGLNG